MNQIGLSPKVVNPTVALAGIGVVVLLLGLIFDESQVVSAGLALLGAAGAAFGVGYASDPGTVVPDPDDDPDVS